MTWTEGTYGAVGREQTETRKGGGGGGEKDTGVEDKQNSKKQHRRRRHLEKGTGMMKRDGKRIGGRNRNKNHVKRDRGKRKRRIGAG